MPPTLCPNAAEPIATEVHSCSHSLLFFPRLDVSRYFNIFTQHHVYLIIFFMLFQTTATDTAIVKIGPQSPTRQKCKLYSLRLSMLKAALNKRKVAFHQQIGLEIQAHETSEI